VVERSGYQSMAFATTKLSDITPADAIAQQEPHNIWFPGVVINLCLDPALCRQLKFSGREGAKSRRPVSVIFNWGRVLNIIFVFIGGKVIGCVSEVSISDNSPLFVCLCRKIGLASLNWSI
tara:strand:+ start:41 stop:403 length:363 start_codon:yes stop_codon:yes gene_type:complete